MKKVLFMVTVTVAIAFTGQLNAQNVFPTSGNVGIGTITPTEKLQVLGGNIATDGAVYASNWFRTYGSTGWYNETYQGGWFMVDTDWIRSFNSKNVYCDKVIRADGGFQVAGLPVIDAGAGWHRTYGDSGWYNGTYEGGLYMIDNTWIRTYNNKAFYSSNTIRTDGELQVGDNGNRLKVKTNGYVGIGSINPDEKLTVKGKIHAEEIRVDLQVPADYVFEKYYTGTSSSKSDYKMPSLSEIETYTRNHNHLPNVPSAQEIKEKGLQVGEMTNTLLQKIEEMTLYMIEMKKEIQQLQKENCDLKLSQEKK
jgi:Bacterial shufflon protein, N-terminal constant region